MNQNMYKTLAVTVGIHFVIMYLLGFVPVNVIDDVKLFNLRNFYMAVTMVAPMVILMLYFMGSMYQNKKRNLLIYSAGVLLFILGFFSIRTQALVGDKQFINSMIPHHSGAITMCEEANITDNELLNLCDEIIRAQQEEIDQMNAILERLRS